ncbi:MAG: Tex family protein [Bacteroidota bacterium]|nr:Tex family protein [Bacteroidota bacterium]
MKEKNYSAIIAKELGIRVSQAENTIKLFEQGSTVPFISRYRKESTGSLDEVAVTEIRDRLEQLKELDKRRKSILSSIEEQGKLTDELKKKILDADSLAHLEDLYLPYKQKRKTRASIAREKGLEPLAMLLISKNLTAPDVEASDFIDEEKGVETTEDALSGARDIIAEWISETLEIRTALRELYFEEAILLSKVVKKKAEEGVKYDMYFDYQEQISGIPSHRILALFRGENEDVLKLKIHVPEEDAYSEISSFYLEKNMTQQQVVKAIADAYSRLLHPSLENEVRAHLKDIADTKAIDVFAKNARQLLLAPPLGEKNILAIDPGFRSGCKVVCLDKNGNLLYNENIYPHPPQRDVKMAAKKIHHLVNTYNIEAIAIGNGTAGRETENFISKVKFDRDVLAIMVNENGASIYSASSVAREEFPEYDITVRGAVSIGRRLMDPLAELVKIDPKSIGVGQYQHDVNQKALTQSLTDTVVSCVNAVGVDVNTASKQILTYVSGIGPTLAENIIKYRKEKGVFKARRDLLKVQRFGDKAFEQAAGFLKVQNAKNPLDASAVHPESYAVVKKMAESLKTTILDLLSSDEMRKRLDLNNFITDKVGMPTLQDIVKELSKPGRDPRDQFEMFTFAKGVNSIEDIKSGMILPAIVTNVTDFGAFVDLGVHQDGLIHISQLADKFIKNPSEVIKLNQKLRVKVLDVDIARKRIQLTLKNI